MKKLRKWIVGSLCVFCAISGIYISDYSHNTNPKALENTESVSIQRTEFGYFFDGPGKEDALIFYPGGKVEDLAYSSLLKEIAANGMDCFLVHMPANLAVLHPNKGKEVLKAYSYKNWYMGGHSLGGSMAASFVSKSSQDFQGLILLASYSTVDLKDKNIKVLSIYGSKDRVMNRDHFKEDQKNLPDSNEIYVISNGNHANFATYGKQDGDGKASISRSQQIKETARKIKEMVGA